MNPVETVLSTSELLEQILFHSDYEDTINFCRTHAYIARFCRDALFWRRKAEAKYGIPQNIFLNTNLNAHDRYLQIALQQGEVFPGAERYINQDEYVRRAIRRGRRNALKHIIGSGYRKWDNMTYEAAKNNAPELLDYFLSKSGNYHLAAEGALEGGHRQLFFDIVQSGPRGRKWDFNKLAAATIRGGHRELFDYINTFGATWNWPDLIRATLEAGNRQLFDHIYSLMPQGTFLDWNVLGAAAVRGGNTQLFDHFRTLAPTNTPWDWPLLVNTALKEGTPNFLDHILALAPGPNWNWDELVKIVVARGDPEMFIHVISLNPTHNWQWGPLAGVAISNNKPEMFDLILASAPANTNWDWNDFAAFAIRNQVPDSMIRHVVDAAPKDRLNFNMLVVTPYYSRRYELVKYLRSLAPANYQWDQRILGYFQEMERSEAYYNK